MSSVLFQSSRKDRDETELNTVLGVPLPPKQLESLLYCIILYSMDLSETENFTESQVATPYFGFF